MKKYKYKFEYKLVKKVSRDINRIVIICHYRSTFPFYSIFIYNIFSYHPTKIFKVIKLFFARFKYVISISCREDPIKPAKIPHFQTELKTFVQKETTLQTEKELFTEQWIKETKKITIKKKEIEMRERKTKNELKQSLTLITQQSKFRLQRRGWRSREERIFRGFFFLFDFSSFDPLVKALYRNLARLKCRREKEHEGSQPKLIGIRERGLTWSFSWKNLANLVGKSCFGRGITGPGNPCLEKQISLPEELAIFESGKNPFLPLQNSPENVVRGIDLWDFHDCFVI